MGLPPTKLLLRLTEQLLHVQQMVFVESTFPVKHSVLCKYIHTYITELTVVLKLESTLYFFSCSLWKRAVREQQKPSLVPAESMLEVMLRKASAARVDRRLRRYYLIVRLLPNVFALACLSLSSI